MKKALVLVLCLAAHSVYAQQILRCDGSQSDCQAKVNSANNGDTVQLPSGIFNWSTNLVINNKNIILNGAGMFDSNTSQTLVTGTGANGNFITYITATDPHTAVLSNIEFSVNNGTVTPANFMIVIQGTALYDPVNNNSGFRMTQVRMTCTNHTSNPLPYNLVITDYVSGVVDHCWWDYPVTASQNGGMSDASQASAPGYRVGSTPIPGSPPTGGWIPMFGMHSASQSYTWGDSTFPQIVYEDNLMCRHTLGIEGTDSGSGNLRGGLKIVVRHNSTHGQIFNTHGFGEAGPADSTYTAELYNNVSFMPITTTFQPGQIRTGAAIDFNNRYLGGWGHLPFVIGPAFNRLTDPGNSIGPADATNYFDYNSKGALQLDANHWPVIQSGNPVAFTFNPDGGSQESDSRVGDIYFRGTSSTNNKPWGTGLQAGQLYTLNNLPGISANELVGFTIRDDTLAGSSDTCDGSAPNDCLGGQGTNLVNDRCAVILSNQATDGNGNVSVLLSAGHDVPACLLGGNSSLTGCNANPPNIANCGMQPNDHWSLRFVITFLGAPGGGYYNGHILNGGVIYQFNTYHLMPAWLDANGSGQYIYWPNPKAEGLWTWDSLYSSDLGVHWNPSTIDNGPTNVLIGRIQGGAHSGAVKTSYPYTATGNTVANCRIGADPSFWNAVDGNNGATVFGGPISYGQNFDSTQPEYNANCAQGFPCGATKHVNVPYPHPLVTGVTPPPPSPTPTPTPTPTSTPLGPAGLEPRKRAFKPL